MIVFLRTFDLVSQAPLVHVVGQSEIVKGPVHVLVAQVISLCNPTLVKKRKFELVEQIVDLLATIRSGLLDEPDRDLVIVGTESIDVFTVGQKFVALLGNQLSGFMVQQ